MKSPGIGRTVFKKKDFELDATTDLHSERQHFNATANVSELNLYDDGGIYREGREDLS